MNWCRNLKSRYGVTLMAISLGASEGMAADPSLLLDTAGRARQAQAACAVELKLPVTMTNAVGMVFRLIPAGSYLMGSDTGRGDAPVHRVTITRPFYMGAFEVTRKQWETVTKLKRSNFFPGVEMPINHITWREAQRFITELNKLEKRAAADACRLPTEAEWELAARAGEAFDPALVADRGWIRENSGLTLHEVGTKPPNAFGLYDLHGNVWEWCSDYYHAGAYQFLAGTDPEAMRPNVWRYRVLRGGSAFHEARDASAGNRAYSQESRSERNIGFRVLLPAGSAVPAQADGRNSETATDDDEEGAQ